MQTRPDAPSHEAPEGWEFEGDADEAATSDPIGIPMSRGH